RIHGGQIQVVDHIANEVGQVVFRQPVPQARRKQKLLIREVRPVALAHETLWAYPLLFIQQKLHFSYGLLEHVLEPKLDLPWVVRGIDPSGNTTVELVTDVTPLSVVESVEEVCTKVQLTIFEFRHRHPKRLCY